MARATKKKKELTIEEKLAEALVPKSEQPYQVPENWCWTQGINIFSPMETQRPEGEKFKYIDIDSIDNKRQLVSTPKEMLVTDAPSRASRKLHQGDTVFSMVRPYLKNIAYIDGSIADSIASTGFYVCTPRLLLNPRYCYYLMVSPYVIDGLNAFMKGDNSPSIRKSDLEKFIYPIPPLPEQQRIVDRIESLFAKLDEAKEKAQAVVDGFEDRKAAILHKAFTGELTKEWRVNNCVDYKKTWNDCALGEFASSQYGYTEKSSYERIGPKFLRITDIQDEQVIWKDVPYCKIDDTLKEKYSLKVGDIVVARIGATTGKSYMVIDQVDAVYASYLIRVTIQKKESLKSKYLYYFLQCPAYWQQITELSSGIAQPGVNGNKLKTLKLPIPDCKEQDEIVRLLDLLLPVEKQARDSAELVLDQIDTMKKSILARAFRGELGTNDPADESAVELLKRVL